MTRQPAYESTIPTIDELLPWMRYVVTEWRARQELAHGVAIAGEAWAATNDEAAVERRCLGALCVHLERVDLAQALHTALDRLEELHKLRPGRA